MKHTDDAAGRKKKFGAKNATLKKKKTFIKAPNISQKEKVTEELDYEVIEERSHRVEPKKRSPPVNDNPSKKQKEIPSIPSKFGNFQKDQSSKRL